jgi:hypothetical protein
MEGELEMIVQFNDDGEVSEEEMTKSVSVNEIKSGWVDDGLGIVVDDENEILPI